MRIPSVVLLTIIERGVWSLCRIQLAIAIISLSPYPASAFSIAVMMQNGRSWTDNVRSRLLDDHGQ